MTTQEITQLLDSMGKRARRASAALAVLPPEAKVQCLESMAQELENNQAKILTANQKDVAAAVQAGMDSAKIDRLTLNADRIKGMADGLRQVASQADPVGKVLSASKLSPAITSVSTLGDVNSISIGFVLAVKTILSMLQ